MRLESRPRVVDLDHLNHSVAHIPDETIFFKKGRQCLIARERGKRREERHTAGRRLRSVQN